MKRIHSIDRDTIQGVCLALTKAYCHTDTDDLLNKDISVTVGDLTFDCTIGIDPIIADYGLRTCSLKDEDITYLFDLHNARDFSVDALVFVIEQAEKLIKESKMPANKRFNAFEMFGSELYVEYKGDRNYDFC